MIYTPIREAKADVTYWLEELQRLLREPSRDWRWHERWMETHERWVASHARYEMLMRRRN
jgi:hypothetical protein